MPSWVRAGHVHVGAVAELPGHPDLRIGKNIEYILATFRGAVNLKDIATFRRGGAPYVDQYFGA